MVKIMFGKVPMGPWICVDEFGREVERLKDDFGVIDIDYILSMVLKGLERDRINVNLVKAVEIEIIDRYNFKILEVVFF